ncbi:MAG: hypothetical protein AAB791_02165 [Patescibacteria group bacterium]
MNEIEINKFLSRLAGSFFLFGPQKSGEVLEIREIKKLEDLDWSGEIPRNTWKEVLFSSLTQLSVL